MTVAKDVVRVEDIFTPDDVLTYTYVSRADETEATLRQLGTGARFVASISGPSKCGKTVTVRRVFGDNLVEVSGSNLSRADDLWNRVLDWMEAPSVTSRSVTAQGSAGGGITTPLFSAQVGGGASETVTESFSRSALQQSIKELSDSDFVIFVDDFH